MTPSVFRLSRLNVSANGKRCQALLPGWGVSSDCAPCPPPTASTPALCAEPWANTSLGSWYRAVRNPFYVSLVWVCIRSIWVCLDLGNTEFLMSGASASGPFLLCPLVVQMLPFSGAHLSGNDRCLLSGSPHARLSWNFFWQTNQSITFKLNVIPFPRTLAE